MYYEAQRIFHWMISLLTLHNKIALIPIELGDILTLIYKTKEMITLRFESTNLNNCYSNRYNEH